MKKILILSLLIASAIFSGCAKNTLEISKCSKYENGICVTKDKHTVIRCEEPTIIGKETYCNK